jgi:hypothetical protein
MGSQPDHSTGQLAGLRHPVRSRGCAIKASKGLKAAVTAELGQLHKTSALLTAVQFASNHECDFDVSDALAVIRDRVEQSIARLDEAEVLP